MIGPLLALLLGGAQGVPPVPEAWNASSVRLVPAKVIPAEAAATPNATGPEDEDREEPGKANLDTDPMPLRLERAVVRPAL